MNQTEVPATFDVSTISCMFRNMGEREANRVQFVYCAIDEPAGLAKIGISENPTKRIKAFNNANLAIAWVMPGTPDDEARAHAIARGYCHCGEWFRLSYRQCDDLLDRIVAEKMEALHHESLEIEEYGIGS